MARRFASIPVDLWISREFRALSPASRYTYLYLVTQHELSACNVLPFLPRRWATCSGQWVESSWAAARELGEHGFLVYDEEQQEAFVSGVFAAEQIGKQPRRVVAAQDALSLCTSEIIRDAVIAELARVVADADPTVPSALYAAVLLRDGYRCRRCSWKPGDPVPAKKGKERPVFRTLEIDHIYPRSLGGRDEEDNLQVLCTSCNTSKGARI